MKTGKHVDDVGRSSDELERIGVAYMKTGKQ
jgi:hypothetical protein